MTVHATMAKLSTKSLMLVVGDRIQSAAIEINHGSKIQLWPSLRIPSLR
jgi:hypothetical protein